MANEIPDAIGFQANGKSILVECKTSKNDYYADNKKMFRKLLPDHGLGDLRYYLTAKGLLDPEKLPLGWGLLEVRGKIIRKIFESNPILLKANTNAEKVLLISHIRELEGWI
jgi:hypothetical protein